MRGSPRTPLMMSAISTKHRKMRECVWEWVRYLNMSEFSERDEEWLWLCIYLCVCVLHSFRRQGSFWFGHPNQTSSLQTYFGNPVPAVTLNYNSSNNLISTKEVKWNTNDTYFRIHQQSLKINFVLNVTIGHPNQKISSEIRSQCIMSKLSTE
jgi:hypothetical protein